MNNKVVKKGVVGKWFKGLSLTGLMVLAFGYGNYLIAAQHTKSKVNQVHKVIKVDNLPYVSFKKTHQVIYVTAKKKTTTIKNGSRSQTKWLKASNGKGGATHWVLKKDYRPLLATTGLKFKTQTQNLQNLKWAYAGDSIPDGWTGSVLHPSSGYPIWLAKYLGLSTQPSKMQRVCRVNSTIMEHRDRDLSTQLHQLDLKHEKLLFIHIGTNDYGTTSNSLPQIQRRLRGYLRWIKRQNKQITVVGILPLPRYSKDVGKNQDTITKAGKYTMGELVTMEAKVYREAGVQTLDIRKLNPQLITDKNHKTVFADQRLHPSTYTQQQLGYAYATQINRLMLNHKLTLK